MKNLFAMGFYRTVVFALAMLLLLLFFSCPLMGSSIGQPSGGEYRVPLASEPVTLDPVTCSDVYAINVAVNLFDGLVEFDKDLNVVPAIAKRWIISRDHRIYTFFLRKGVKFHNGREVTAEDFVYSFHRLLNPETNSPAGPLFSYVMGAKAFVDGKSKTVTGFSAPDRYTFKVELKEPFAPFLSILATANAKVVPKEAIDADFGFRPIGTGAFRFHSWDRGHSIILSKNNDYFREKARIDILRFRIYSNDQWDLIFSDFEKGLLDQAIIPRNKYDEIVANPHYTQNYQFISRPGLNLVYLGMNETVPPFNDVRVRQAISYAVDTETIVRQITRLGSVPAKSILPPGIAGFDPDYKGYSYDPREARKLLAQAGYPEGRGIAPIEIWTVSKSESVKNELLAYQKYFAKIGIQLIPKVSKNWKEFIQLINEKKAPMFYAAWYADYPDPDNFLYILFHSKSSTNRMAYHNPIVDRMLEEARHMTDYMKRVEMYRNIEKLVMGDAVVICQHINSFNCLLQPWVTGMNMSYLGPTYVPFRKVGIDHAKFAKYAIAQ